jgi:hypothetical protein
MAKAATNRTYQLKVTLAGPRPIIWRRLLVSSSSSLKELHYILQVAMGWTDSHLHQFEAKGQLYGKPGPELDLNLPMKDEARAALDQLLVREKDSMLYEYDLGDSWTHQIVLEKILPTSPQVKVPQCTAGARACPPEDCGGVFGYVELLKALKDPSHPEHDDMLEWIGDDYDPTFFDLEAVNKQLARQKRGL